MTWSAKPLAPCHSLRRKAVALCSLPGTSAIHPMPASTENLRPTVFLDRDGVVNVDIGYAYRPGDLCFTPTAADAIGLLNRSGCLVVVATNQSGVARGFFGLEDVALFHAEISRRLAVHGAHIDAFYVAPFHRDGSVSPYNIDHDDRKPGAGMLVRAMREWPVAPEKSILIGDKASDIEAADRAGIASILVPSDVCDLAAVVREWLATTAPEMLRGGSDAARLKGGSL
jgi:D-glycero-D-manno-heptose 1,7-bisphosphate phosphatase